MFVVLVDQDAAVLAALEADLAACGVAWDIECVTNAATALAICESRPVDMVVTDQRLPMMHGAMLLREVRKRRPEALRVLLCDDLAGPAARRALDIAHRALLKPCRAGVLIEMADRLAATRLRLADAAVALPADPPFKWPAAPGAYAALTEAIDVGETDATRIARIIDRVPGLASRVLQLVDADRHGEPATPDVATAYGRIGLRALRDMVLAVEVYTPERCGSTETAERRQDRALQAAAYASLLVDEPLLAATASAGALLADVGLLVTTGDADADARADAGALLLAHWGLPATVIETALFLHAPRVLDVPGPAIVAAHIARAIADRGDFELALVVDHGLAERVAALAPAESPLLSVAA